MNSVSKILRTRDNASLKFTVHRASATIDPTPSTARQHPPVPVLFLHPCAANMWGRTIESTVERCGDRVQVVAFARRGFDENRAPAPPGTWKTGWEDAAEILGDVVDSERKAVLVAWSLGSVIALGLAATQSSRIASVILVEPEALQGNASRVAELLKEAGVQVTLKKVDGCNHLMPLQRVGSETIVDAIHIAVS
ncbi:hypothetical protein HDU93_007974 [Gonapodya sp. JEL0774]|nr:hypothetical protein HDU93_007974 [Gonapodya sp. JEL0774]